MNRQYTSSSSWLICGYLQDAADLSNLAVFQFLLVGHISLRFDHAKHWLTPDQLQLTTRGLEPHLFEIYATAAVKFSD